ncbi:hypothetical protein D3C77_579500 [compost metagenome]
MFANCSSRCSGVLTDFFFAGMKVPPGGFDAAILDARQAARQRACEARGAANGTRSRGSGRDGDLLVRGVQHFDQAVFQFEALVQQLA